MTIEYLHFSIFFLSFLFVCIYISFSLKVFYDKIKNIAFLKS